MAANFIKIPSIEALSDLFAASKDRPVVIFKHSNSCGISADLFHQVASIDGDVHLVVVQERRDISDKIAELTGIRHASPQAFVISEGNPVYQSSHYGIDPRAIQKELDTSK
mgnify:CR=1 FL=1